MKLFLNCWPWFAFLLSTFWGVFGCIELNKCWKGWKTITEWKDNILAAGIFISEFIGSFAGWCCLYIFSIRLQHMQRLSNSYLNMGTIDIFLIIGAFVGMAGYSFQIINSIADVIKNMKHRSKNAPE